MSNYIMNVDIFGNNVRCETEGLLVCLNDLLTAGNAVRTQKGRAPMQLAAFMNAVGTKEYLLAASAEWGVPESELLFKTGAGRHTRTMAHISIALLCAEGMSPEFHARMHRTLVEGKLLEFRDLGGTEFKALNASIDAHLPEREMKSSNKGVFIQVAKMLREKIMGEGATADCWAAADTNQTHARYDYERRLSDYLKMGMIRNYDHLKEVIIKLN